jgi:Flp pilus assembly protein TadD
VTTPSDQTGSLEAAIRHTETLLEQQPELAIEQAKEILKSVPKYPPADLLLAIALFRIGKTKESLSALDRIVREQNKWAAAHFEYGIILGALGRGDEALFAMQKTVELKPQHPEAWRFLGDHLMATGRSEEGDRAYAQHVRASAKNPALQQAAAAMSETEVPTAERLL